MTEMLRYSRPPDASPTRAPGRIRPGTHIERAVFANALFACEPVERRSAFNVAKTLWADNVTELLVQRATTSPANRTTSGWASQLAVAAVGDFISSLQPLSAGARILDLAPRVSLDGINTIAFPVRSGAIDASAVGWIPEGAPIPVGQFSLTAAAQLGPSHKLGLICAMTREVVEHASGEVVVTQLMRENAAVSLDASLFSNAAATADRPAGLLAGVAALTGAPAGDDAAMATDLTALAAAIGTVTTGLVYVAHPAQAYAIKLRRGSTFPSDVLVLPTLGVAEGVLIALDPACLVSGFSSTPEITASKEALVHMDTAPAPISATGTPNTVSAPVRSYWQTDVVGVRLILRAAWTWRVSGAISWIANTSW